MTDEQYHEVLNVMAATFIPPIEFTPYSSEWKFWVDEYGIIHHEKLSDARSS